MSMKTEYKAAYSAARAAKTVDAAYAETDNGASFSAASAAAQSYMAKEMRHAPVDLETRLAQYKMLKWFA